MGSAGSANHNISLTLRVVELPLGLKLFINQSSVSGSGSELASLEVLLLPALLKDSVSESATQRFSSEFGIFGK